MTTHSRLDMELRQFSKPATIPINANGTPKAKGKPSCPLSDAIKKPSKKSKSGEDRPAPIEGFYDRLLAGTSEHHETFLAILDKKVDLVASNWAAVLGGLHGGFLKVASMSNLEMYSALLIRVADLQASLELGLAEMMDDVEARVADGASNTPPPPHAIAPPSSNGLQDPVAA